MAVRHQGKTCISDIWVAHRNSLGCVFYKSTNHVFGLRSCWSSLSQDCGNPVTLCLSYYSFIIGKKVKVLEEALASRQHSKAFEAEDDIIKIMQDNLYTENCKTLLENQRRST